MKGLKVDAIVPWEVGIIIVVIGALALLYHAHLWYYVEGKKKDKDKDEN